MTRTRILSLPPPKETKGAIKEAAGNAKLIIDGKSDNAEGKVQNAVGGLKDAWKK